MRVGLGLGAIVALIVIGTAGAATSLAWTPRAGMPTARGELGVVTGPDGKVYAIGGLTATASTDVVEAYDAATDSWAPRASLPATRRAHAVALAGNGKIYSIGGGTSGSAVTSKLFEYDAGTDSWATKADNNIPRAASAASAANGKVYAIGGVTVQTSPYVCSAAVEEYDPATDTWSTKTSMPTARCFLGAATALNGKIYAVGGFADSGPSPLATVEEYDPVADVWTTKTSMPTARGRLALVTASNGRLYAIGGGTNSSLPFATVEEYDPTTDTWSSQTALTVAREDLGAAVSGARIYAIGSGGASGVLGTNEEGASLYNFAGFFQPVDMDAVNRAKAGSAIPVKFSLGSDEGLDIFAAGYPRSVRYTCGVSIGDDIEETVTAGASSLVYDALTDRYTYVWKTDKAWAGTCRELQVRFDDGTTRTAKFQFTK